LSIESCKKTDSIVADANKEIIEETPENFFKVPDNASPVLKRIAKELERQNKTKEFITAFIAKEGFPIWAKSRIERQRKNGNISDFDADGLEDTTVYIPLVVSAENYVTGFLKATVDDSVHIKIFRQGDYLNFPFKTPTVSPNVTTAEQYAIRFMSMDNDVFGSTEFKIEDKRMFNNSTDYSDTANFQRFIKLVPDNKEDEFANGSTINNYQYEVCWSVETVFLMPCFSGNNTSSIEGQCYYSGYTSHCVTYESGGTGEGSPPGTWPFGGGGINGGSSNIPCTNDFGGTNSFIPIDCDPVEGNQWPPESPESWYDNIWLTYNVKDSTNDACIKKALDTLNSIQTKLPNLIRGFFGARPDFEMVFKQHTDPVWKYEDGASTPSAPPGAITIETTNGTNFTVFINKYYSDCTDLGLAATIIHEAMHCYLLNRYRAAYFSPDSTAIRIALATEWGYLFPPLPINPSFDSILSVIINGQNPTMHNDMILRYQTLVADALYQFALAKGISIDSAYCRDLAWSGCFDSKAFANIPSPTDKTRIKNRCSAEKDPYNSISYTDGNGTFYVNENAYPEKGNPCH